MNSVNGEPEVLERVLPIVKKYGASVVGLTLDKNGIPKTAEERVAIARRILQAALDHGIPREDVWIDCLTLTVSAQAGAGCGDVESGADHPGGAGAAGGAGRVQHLLWPAQPQADHAELLIQPCMPG